MDKIITVVATNQALFRIGVCYILSGCPDIAVYSTALDASLVQVLGNHSPRVLLLDIDEPSYRGLGYAEKISARFPDTRIMIMTFAPDDRLLFRIIRSGAVAYLDKSITERELIKAVRAVSNGEFPIDTSILERPEVAVSVLRQFQNEHGLNGKSEASKVTPLTSRETQILTHIAEGNSNKQIASILQISEQTAKNHVSNILRKLRANDRAHAVMLAIRRGWILAEEMPVSVRQLTATSVPFSPSVQTPCLR